MAAGLSAAEAAGVAIAGASTLAGVAGAGPAGAGVGEPPVQAPSTSVDHSAAPRRRAQVRGSLVGAGGRDVGRDTIAGT